MTAERLYSALREYFLTHVVPQPWPEHSSTEIGGRVVTCHVLGGQLWFNVHLGHAVYQVFRSPASSTRVQFSWKELVKRTEPTDVDKVEMALMLP